MIRLISSQNEKIKSLLDEINNESLTIEVLLENLKDQSFSYRGVLVILIIHVKNEIPRTNHSSNLRKLLKRVKFKT